MVLMPALQAPAIVQEDPQPAAQVAHNQSIFSFLEVPKAKPIYLDAGGAGRGCDSSSPGTATVCPVFIMAGKSHETGSENPNNSSAESETTQNCRYF